MKCLLPLAAILLLAHPSSAAKRSIACKTSAIAASCYQAHGRLGVYNGTPSWRLWKIGTPNLLAIFSGPEGLRCDTSGGCVDNEAPELPANLKRIFASVENPVYQIQGVYADFEICPLEPHIPGHMQAACIESATHLVVKK